MDEPEKTGKVKLKYWYHEFMREFGGSAHRHRWLLRPLRGEQAGASIARPKLLLGLRPSRIALGVVVLCVILAVGGQIPLPFEGDVQASTAQASIDETRARPSLRVELQKAEPTRRTDQIDYFALGDSIASGHGLSDFGRCRQSTKAYPFSVLRALKSEYRSVRFFHYACSGAVAGPRASDVKPAEYTRGLDHPWQWLHNQVDLVLQNLGDDPTLVTITVGANDFEWLNLAAPARLGYLSGDAFRSWADLRANQVSQSVTFEVLRLLEKPNVSVILTEQFNPFNPESTVLNVGGRLYPNSTCLDPEGFNCQLRGEWAVQSLNRALGLIPGQTDYQRVRLAYGIADKFRNHEAPFPCGLAKVGETFIQYPLSWSSNSILGTGDCFHPNESGAFVIADQVYAAAEILGFREHPPLTSSNSTPTSYPTYTPYPTLTPYPTYTPYPTCVPCTAPQRGTATPTPSPTPAADTKPGTILAVGDEWRQNGVGLRLVSYYLWPDSSYRNIGLVFYFSNRTNSSIVLSVSKNDIEVTTASGRTLTSFGYEYCVRTNPAVVPAMGSFDFTRTCRDLDQYFWITTSLAASDLAQVNVRVLRFTSRISDARWQFSIQN